MSKSIFEWKIKKGRYRHCWRNGSEWIWTPDAYQSNNDLRWMHFATVHNVFWRPAHVKRLMLAEDDRCWRSSRALDSNQIFAGCEFYKLF